MSGLLGLGVGCFGGLCLTVFRPPLLTVGWERGGKTINFGFAPASAMHRAGQRFCAGQAVRTGGALLILGGGENPAGDVVTSHQPVLVTDAQGGVRELVNA